jgi:hypothetical protein
VSTGPPKKFENLLKNSKFIDESSKFSVFAHPKIEKWPCAHLLVDS